MADASIGAAGATAAEAHAGDLRIEVLRDAESILALEHELVELCEDLCEPNPFFEPWFLIPSVRHLGQGNRWHVLCLYESGGRRRLCGFLPLIVTPLHRDFPLPTYEIWSHSQCFRSTPLVRSGYAARFWETTLSWLGERPWHRRLLHLRGLPAQGELWRALQASLGGRTSFVTLSYRFDTAFLRVKGSYADALDRAMSKRTQRKLGQQGRRFDEQGSVTFSDTGDFASIDALIEEFLQLESSGWKGQEGTALACSRSEAAFFGEVIRAAYGRGRLTFLTLRLDGRMIAATCVFYTSSGAFQFKTAYDESLRKFSPGVLLELEEMRRAFEQKDGPRGSLAWVDSCAGPGNGPNFRCWPHRMPVVRYRITTVWTPHALPLFFWKLCGGLVRSRRGRVGIRGALLRLRMFRGERSNQPRSTD